MGHDEFNPKSNDAMFSQILTEMQNTNRSLLEIKENQYKLWAAHTELKVKVVAISTIISMVGVFVGFIVDFIFGGKHN